MKKYIVALALSSLLASTALAQTSGYGFTEPLRSGGESDLEKNDDRDNARTNVEALRREAIKKADEARELLKQNTGNLRGVAKEEIEVLRENLKVEAQKLRDGVTSTSSVFKKEVRDQIKDKRENLRDAISQKREELKEKVETERAELKAKLAKIRDERKKSVVEKIDNEIKKLNERMVDHFADVVSKLQKTLDRITERMDRAASRGLDVSTVKTALSEADNAIAAAEAAIKDQAAKTYTVSIKEEGTLKTDISEVRKQLNEDLRKVRDSVFAAREAVRKVAVALAQIPKPAETATTTAQQ